MVFFLFVCLYFCVCVFLFFVFFLGGGGFCFVCSLGPEFVRRRNKRLSVILFSFVVLVV